MECSGRGVRLATYLHVVTMLRIGEIVRLIVLGAFKACGGDCFIVCLLDGTQC